MTAITTPYNVGTGPMMFLSPDYLPVLGSCGRNPTAWSYGGGGNYPRPFTSYTQRIVEASNSLGPFARRVGGGASGRVILSIYEPSSGQLAFREQPWYGFNDGNTGYVSKAEWWDKSIKVYVQLRDVHVAGHPTDVFEVAFQSLGELDQYTAQWQFVNILGGILAPYLGALTGIPSDVMDAFSELGDWAIGGSGLLSDSKGETFQSLDADYKQAFETVATLFPQHSEEIRSALHTQLNGEGGNELGSEWAISRYLRNWFEGYIMGDIGLKAHVAHNLSPKVNGSFDHVPGELKNNPTDIPWPDWAKENFASTLGSGAMLDPATGNAVTDSNELADILGGATGIGGAVSKFGHGTGEPGLGGYNPKGIGVWLVFGTTVYNEHTANELGGDPTYAAQNPYIDNQGVYHHGDTYDFAGNGLSPYIQWLNSINPALYNGVNSFLDTSPAFHKSGMLSYTGKIRQENDGQTSDNVPFSGIQHLQNSYVDVAVTPQQMKDGNPTLYQTLKDQGYYSHVDPSLLP
tara:strand:- start:1311 stop:2864 length:1554 start_codon:yes stop_codon:yes gene_type:complete